MNYSHPLAIRLRRVGQKLGILRPFVRAYRRLTNSAYEQEFDRSLIAYIRDGDVVWDVGANVGFFTGKFSQSAGTSGKVIAFEPAPDTFLTLKSEAAAWPNVTVENIALADFQGESSFRASDTVNDPTNGLRASDDGSSATVKVAVTTGDQYCQDHAERIPTVIKIDVEGFELEVLRGLDHTLRQPRLKAIFMEVHFQVLAMRGMTNAPLQIADILGNHHFKLAWTDPSHFVATRVLESH